jgi:hypothetical protein
MNTKSTPSTAAKPKSKSAQARSAEALRANLLKRKTQAKARAGHDPKPGALPVKDEASS